MAEFLGTAVLLSAIVGSGIVVADGGGDAASQLFQHAVVVGAALVALILAFGPVSGAHLNPVVTLADWWFGGIATGRAVRYVVAQVTGAAAGVLATDAMFGREVAALATTVRGGLGAVAGEALATAGLVLVIFALVRSDRGTAVPAAVGAWIAAAVVFTASDAFANPAVTLARALTDTWTGIAPSSVPGFLLGQALGGLVGTALAAWLYRPTDAEARDVLVPHDEHRPTTTPHAPPDRASRRP